MRLKVNIKCYKKYDFIKFKFFFTSSTRNDGHSDAIAGVLLIVAAKPTTKWGVVSVVLVVTEAAETSICNNGGKYDGHHQLCCTCV